MLCGARTRSGGRCRRHPVRGRGRCRNHGGCSTGAGAALVWRPAVAAMVVGRRAYIERRHSLGLKAPGGRKSGRWWRKPVDEQERTLRIIDDKLDTLPAPPDRPLEAWALAEILGDNARLALLRQREILVNPITPEMDLK